MNSSESLVVIALGSNLGDSRKVISEAMDRLDAFAAGPVRRSSLWKSTPVDCPPGSPTFVNAVVTMEPLPDLTAESLLEALHALEAESGRRARTVRNEPRALDLDLIAFGQEQRSGPDLVLPHPRAHQRRFVLAPLAEIAPELILPGHRRTVSELLNDLSTGAEQEGVSKI